MSIVKQFFETMGLHGKYVDAVDLEDYMQLIKQRSIDEVKKPNVVEAIEHTTAIAKRFGVVKEELLRSKEPTSSVKVRDRRQQSLMDLCAACERRPQRLTTLSTHEEKGRWQCTLQAFDRLLWEAMRPEFLEDKVVNPESFVEGIEELVVCHCDQVPVWLRIGSQKQLYRAEEVNGKKNMRSPRPFSTRLRARCKQSMRMTACSSRGRSPRVRVIAAG